MRLTTEQYRTLSQLRQTASGKELIKLLQDDLNETDIGNRTATGERLGWGQGRAQCLVDWIKHLTESERHAS